MQLQNYYGVQKNLSHTMNSKRSYSGFLTSHQPTNDSYNHISVVARRYQPIYSECVASFYADNNSHTEAADADTE